MALVPVFPGNIVYAAEYNYVADIANLIFGDNYPGSLVTDTNRILTHKWGWGAPNIDDQVPVGVLIEADRLQLLVEHTNVMLDHVTASDHVIVFSVPANRTDVKPGYLVRAEDLNLVHDKMTNLIQPNDMHATVDPLNASLITATSAIYSRTVPWWQQLSGEHKFQWSTYNDARYFFNGGGQLQLDLEMENGCTAGYYNWSDIINEVGTLTFTWNNTFQSDGYLTPGTSEGKGFYHLTNRYGDGSDPDGVADNEGLLFTSSNVTQTAYIYKNGSAYGYAGMFMDNDPGTGYFSAYATGYHCSTSYVYLGPQPSAYGYTPNSISNYADRRFKLYGKWADDGKEVHFKIVLDDTNFGQVIDGTFTVTPRYLMPDIITINTSEFDVSPDPTYAVIDDFNSANDS